MLFFYLNHLMSALLLLFKIWRGTGQGDRAGGTGNGQPQPPSSGAGRQRLEKKEFSRSPGKPCPADGSRMGWGVGTAAGGSL